MKRLRIFAALIALLVWALPTKAAQLAIIIDDVGYARDAGLALIDLPYPVTLAIIPFTPHGVELANKGHAAGHGIMLHAPMSNTQGFALGRGGLYDTMTQSELTDQLNRNIDAIPHVTGVNNHMGSLLTQNRQAMGWVMDTLNERHLFFVDSRTTAATQAENLAREKGTPHRRRDIFLDHVQTYAHSKAQLNAAIALAKTRGSSVAIGHPYPTTLRVLQELAEQPDADITLVSVSHLMPSFVQPPRPTYQPQIRHCPMPEWLWRDYDAPNENPINHMGFEMNNSL